jgi:hypothetical protein
MPKLLSPMPAICEMASNEPRMRQQRHADAVHRADGPKSAIEALDRKAGRARSFKRSTRCAAGATNFVPVLALYALGRTADGFALGLITTGERSNMRSAGR